jgi:hypothetical protein
LLLAGTLVQQNTGGTFAGEGGVPDKLDDQPVVIRLPRPRASDEEGGRDLPDSGVFAFLDAFTVLGISALVVVGLWKLKGAVVAAISW